MEAILNELRSLSITLSKNNDQIDVFDPNGNLSEKIIAEIKRSKADILNYLEKSEAPKAHLEIPVAPKQEFYPLSPAQRRLYFLYEFDKESLAYNMPQIFRVKGNLDKNHLESTFGQLIERHESLRTNFDLKEGIPVQILREKTNFQIQYFKGKEEEVDPILDEFIKPFDLRNDCLVRVGVIQVSHAENILVFDMHHIIGDGVSNGILVNDFKKLYDNETLPPLRLHYKDYTSWMASESQRAVIKKDESFWLNTFEDIPVLNLPLDYKRPMAKSNKGGSVPFKLTKEETEKLKATAQECGVTLFMMVFTVYNLLLYKLTNQEDIVIGIPTRGRDHIDLEEIIGMFVNTLPIRSTLTGSSQFVDVLKAISKNTLSSFDHQSYPYDELVESLKIKRTSNRNPLFDVSFTFDSFGGTSAKITGLQFEGYEKKIENSKADISLVSAELGEGLNFVLEYDADLFERATIERFSDYFKLIVRQVIQNKHVELQHIDILPEKDKALLLSKFNPTVETPTANITVLEWFVKQVEKSPNDIAVRFGENEISYCALDERSNQLANYLVGNGVDSEQLIPIYMERSIEMVVAILGVLKSGGAYVPIDPSLPNQRISYMLADIGTRILLTQKSLNDSLVSNYNPIALDAIANELQKESAVPPKVLINPKNLCYVIYTSGTTGKPKGVMVEHQGVANMVHNQIKLFELTKDDTVLQFASFSFDAFVSELFTSLLSGAKLIMTTRACINSVDRIHELIKTEKISCVTLPPSYQTFLLQNTHDLRIIISAGEAMKQEYSEAFAKHGVQLVNAYGPTENTVCTTLSNNPINQGRVTIGGPLNGVKVYILDSNGKLCPIGCAGELCVSGLQVARGYLNAPELTAKSFIDNPYGTGAYGRLYKTGDLCRWMPDGSIEFLGRTDNQVKIRGYRIELGEVENALRTIQGIEQCVVIPDADGQSLIAYYTKNNTHDLEQLGNLKQPLGSLLPDYMVPSTFVPLDTIPLTSNGKVNVRKLKQTTQNQNFTKPKSSIEEGLLSIWAEVLQLNANEIGTDSDFFELGGQSLKAMTLANKINTEFSMNLQVDDVFTNSTIATLAEQVSQKSAVDLLRIPKAPEQSYYAVSSAQQRMYVLYQLAPSSLAYNMPQCYKVTGHLDIPRLENTFLKLLNRHESLKTTFQTVNGKVVQKIIENETFQIEKFDWSDAQVEAGISAFIRPFDLHKGYPIRVGLAALESGEYILLIDMHHIINDGQSHDILLQDFWALYSDKQLAPLSLQYRDFAEWQQHEQQEGELLKQKSFWLQEFEDEVKVLDLPLDYERPETKSTEGGEYSFVLNAEETESLKQFAKEENVTLFVLMLSFYNVLLAKLSNQQDIVIGVPTSGRSNSDLEKIVGLFLNILPIRNQVAGNLKFVDFVREVKTRVLNCLGHQQYQYDELVEALKIDRNTGRNPLFDTVFTYQEQTQSQNKEKLEIEINPLADGGKSAKFDLEMFISVTEKEMDISLVYCAALFGAKRIRTFSRYFKGFINQLTHNKNIKISDMSTLTEFEKKEIVSSLHEDNEKTKMYNTSVTRIFENIVSRNEENVALQYGELTTTYLALNESANKFSNYLTEDCGIQQGDIVAVRFKATENLMACILGILKSGATYLPIDVFTPGERLLYMLSDSGAKCLISDENRTEVLPVPTVLWSSASWSDKSTENRGIMAGPEQSVYIIYTSGTTGMPKGTCIPNRALVNYINWFMSSYDLDATDQTVLMSSYAFDLCYTSLWGSILSGGTLHLLDVQKHFEPSRITDYLVQNPITYLKLTPSHFKMLSNSDAFLDSIEQFDLRLVVLGGEVVDLDDISKYLSKVPILFVNEYGPTEATVGTIAYNIDRRKIKRLASNAIIGKPVDNTTIFILDDNLSVVPEGTKGEICISGMSLATGYLKNPELTNEKFVNNPFSRNKCDYYLYRTGDYAKMLPDGNIEFIGRIDDQLNIRGYRIGLTEIESTIDEFEEVEKSVVMAMESQLGDKQLVAFVVRKEGNELEEFESIAKLSKKLPEYMIPRFVFLDAFPLTWNGKIDKKELLNYDIQLQVPYIAPETQTEIDLIAIWSEILEIDQGEIGRHGDFFQLGGHSLLAIDLTSRINQKFSKEISLSDVFDGSTIRELSKIIDRQKTVVLEAESDIRLLKQGEEQDVNLFFIHDVSGTINGYMQLVTHLKDYNCYGLDFKVEAFGPENTTVEKLAAHYIQKIKKVQQTGPYNLVGWSLGGVVLYEMARQLEATGDTFDSLVLIDTVFSQEKKEQQFLIAEEEGIIETIIEDFDMKMLDNSSIKSLWTSFVESEDFNQMELEQLFEKIPRGYANLVSDHAKNDTKEIVTALNTVRTIKAVCENYILSEPINTDILFIKASESSMESEAIEQQFECSAILEVEGNHFSIMAGEQALKIGDILSRSLQLQ